MEFFSWFTAKECAGRLIACYVIHYYTLMAKKNQKEVEGHRVHSNNKENETDRISPMGPSMDPKDQMASYY